ncbi:GAD-like domain-containing protein [Acinetobacter bereziniae]|uniref:GAD-like domain-containing protein n=3 Tax=Acinetobacter bereziniae TaxID=106648 RepID=UPI000C2C27CA|nr:GAD-like domain-containing protein [Acinetobacter bereziniae]ATZ64820.1 GAD-like protein [Acinetobacter bereziniae]
MSKFIMDENFEIFYLDEGFGPPIYSEVVSDDIINKYKGKLPTQLLEYWKAFGFSGWGNGLFWLVNPEEYQDTLDVWLENIETQPHEEYFVIARSAFGDLEIWGTIHGNCYTISPIMNQIFPNIQDIETGEEDLLIRIFISSKEKKLLDIKDYRNKPLFERAVKKYGELTKNEMFGFEPALVLGGEAKLENVRKLPIISHLQILASLDTPRMMLDIGKYVDEQGLD